MNFEMSKNIQILLIFENIQIHFFIEIELLDKIIELSERFILHFEISGITKSELHPLKILFILNKNKFHFEIFGTKVNKEQSLKRLFKLLIFLVFHFEISGKDINVEQSLNIKLISLTFSIFQLEISGNFCNDKQLQNK